MTVDQQENREPTIFNSLFVLLFVSIFLFIALVYRQTDLSLLVRYWGYEWGSRKFDIFVDEEKLISEDNTGRWYQSQYQEVMYPIPDKMLKDKDHIRIKFEAAPKSTAGAVYYMRLVKPEKNK